MKTNNKWIKGYEFKYSINVNGDVISHIRNKKLTGNMASDGYRQVSLYDNNGRQKLHYVHRLVTQAFVPNPENKPCVNHLDGDKLNNHVSNLEWATHKENAQHAYDTGLKTQYKGSKHYNTKLSVRDALHIKDLTILTNLLQREIGALYKVSQGTVSLIKRKTHQELINYYK